MIVIVSPSHNNVYYAGKTLSVCWIYNPPLPSQCAITIELRWLYAQHSMVLASNSNNIGVFTWEIPSTIESGLFVVCISDTCAIGNMSATSNEFRIENTFTPLLSTNVEPMSSMDAFPMSMSIEQQQLYTNPIVTSSHQSPSDENNEDNDSVLRFVEAILTVEERERPQTSSILEKFIQEQKEQQELQQQQSIAGQQGMTQPFYCKQYHKSTAGLKRLDKQKIVLREQEIHMSTSVVRKCLGQMLNDDNIQIDFLLSNNDTVGQFSIKYLIMHAQKREIKKEKEKKNKKKT